MLIFGTPPHVLLGAALALLLFLVPTGKIVAAERLQEVTVREGDTLWGIANYYLKDPKRWPEILKYNPLSLSDPAAALPGMKLKIPVLLIKEELRKASLVYLLNDVRYRKRNESEWYKATPNAELFNDYGLRTLEESRAHVRFFSGDILKMDQNSLVVLRPELKAEEVNLLAGTLQAGRVKLVTATAQVTPLSRDTLYKARLRIDKGLIIQVERGSTEVLGTHTGRRVIVQAEHATIAFPERGPSDPVKVANMPGLQTVDFDESDRVIVPAGHANITLPDRSPSIPVEIPSLPDFQMVDFNESGKPVIPSLYAKKERSKTGGSFEGVAPIQGYKPRKGESPKLVPDGSGKSPEIKSGGKRGKTYRVQFSLDSRFSKIALNKIGRVDEVDPTDDKSDFGVPDGIYYRRIYYLNGEGQEGEAVDLPVLEVDKLPPVIRLLKPPEKFTTRKKFVAIEGQTKQRSFVRINDYQVSIKPDGRFSWSVLLADGSNKLSIVVTDRKGRVTTLERTVTKTSQEVGGKPEEE